MITADVCSGGKSVRQGVPLAEAFGDQIVAGDGEKGRVVWVDIESPTDEDWEHLQSTFHFHPLALEDAKNQSQRAKMDAYDGFLFLSLRAWHGGKAADDDLDDATQEIDIFLGPNYIVTIHEGKAASVEETRRRWQRHPEELPQARESPAYLLYLLMDAVVDAFFPAMDSLDEEIDDIEMAVYDDKAPLESGNLRPSLRLKKRLLLLRQALTPLRDILNEILRTDNARLLPPELRVYWQDVYDHSLRLVEQVDLHRDILSGAVDAIMAQTSNRLNQVMKTMTAISTILMSAALLASIWGMNFKFMPELEWRYAYPCALGTMVLVALVLVWHFRRIRWL